MPRTTDWSVLDPAELSTAAAAIVHRRTRVVADFPQPGVLFRDITPVLADPDGLSLVAAALASGYEFDLVAGIDARGFLLGAAVAIQRSTGVLAIRKPGKLAGEVIGENYRLEYGTARVELHPDDVPAGARVLVVDDVLATGGTASAAVRLLQRAGAAVAAVSVIVELLDLGGRAAVEALAPVSALLVE